MEIQDGPCYFRFNKNNSLGAYVVPKMLSMCVVELVDKGGYLALYTTFKYSVSSRGIFESPKAYLRLTGFALYSGMWHCHMSSLRSECTRCIEDPSFGHKKILRNKLGTTTQALTPLCRGISNN